MSTSSISSPARVSSKASASNSKIWLFRVLTLAAGGVMLVSWFMPWWMAKIDAIHDATIMIRPWGLEHNLGPDFGPIVAAAAMPAFFAPFMWTFLGVCMLALILSLFAPDKALGVGKFKLSLPQLILGGVGVAYIVCLIVAVVYASMRMDTPQFYNMKFIGYTQIVLDVEMASGGVTADLLPGYWLAWVVGVLMVVLALLRNKIVGVKQA